MNFKTLITIFGLSLSSMGASAAELTWTFKSYVRVESQVNGDALTTVAKAGELQIQAAAEKSLKEILNPMIENLESISQEDPAAAAEAILEAASELKAVIEELKMSYPGVVATATFVLAPWEKGGSTESGSLIDNDNEFAKRVLHNMNQRQAEKYGLVANGASPIYLLGAVASVDLTKKGGEARVQVVTGLNPQRIAGANDLIVWEPSGRSKSQDTSKATVMFTEIVQPLALEMPIMKFKFGRVDTLRPSGRHYRFDVMDEGRCSRVRSAPTIIKKVTLPSYLSWPFGSAGEIMVPLYDLEINTGSLSITSAKVRPMMCMNLDFVNDMFMDKANKTINEMKTAVGQLLNASPEEFTVIIKQMRAKDGVKGAKEL